MEDIFKRYELLCEDVRHQINFIDDYYVFDFDNFEETLKEMKDLQNKIRESD